MLVPAVFAVLMKMNLYLWDKIIEECWSAYLATPRLQLADVNGFRQAAVADDLFSETFPLHSYSENGG